MKAITTAIRELWGLFVEDASFTIGILACLALAIFVFPRLVAIAHWRGPLLFGALALMLIENVRRGARP
ncbi:MAG: hypothetical protein M3Z23_12055 [Acidobacteriota bacterium]|nr:hypothetical protein [Acidobacteriota bacterium]